MTRIAVLSDVHGNILALEAVRKALRATRPDAILIGGDHVLNGPEPAATIDALREMEADGALIVQGNTDIAVADFDYTAAFPWLADGGIPDSFRAVAEWTHEAIGPERVDWLRRLPAERRLRAADGTLVLLTHGSPGSQTQGFDQALDPTVTIERAARTDARIIACGHTHLPEVRDLGFKLIVNDGSAGYVFDGDPQATWALITIEDGVVRSAATRAAAARAARAAEAEPGEADEVADELPGADAELDADADEDEREGRTAARVTAEIRRESFDALAVANAISSRGLPGDVYRAATVRTGKLVR